MGLFNKIGGIFNWLKDFSEELWNGNIFKGLKYLTKMAFGPVIGAYSTALTGCAAFVSWAGKMIDSIIVPFSPFTSFLSDKKTIISDEWWKSALEKSLGAFKKSYELMLFPFTDTLKKTGNTVSSWLSNTGTGDLSGSGKSTDFGKDLKGLVIDPDKTLRKHIDSPNKTPVEYSGIAQSSGIDHSSEIPNPIAEPKAAANVVQTSQKEVGASK